MLDKEINQKYLIKKDPDSQISGQLLLTVCLQIFVCYPASDFFAALY